MKSSAFFEDFLKKSQLTRQRPDERKAVGEQTSRCVLFLRKIFKNGDPTKEIPEFLVAIPTVLQALEHVSDFFQKRSIHSSGMQIKFIYLS